jgi:hypothetical protein
MSDFQPLGSLDAVREYQRLIAAQAAAIRSKDPDAIEQAAHEMTLFLRYSGQGRLAEYFASRRTDA